MGIPTQLSEVTERNSDKSASYDDVLDIDMLKPAGQHRSSSQRVEAEQRLEWPKGLIKGGRLALDTHHICRREERSFKINWTDMRAPKVPEEDLT